MIQRPTPTSGSLLKNSLEMDREPEAPTLEKQSWAALGARRGGASLHHTAASRGGPGVPLLVEEVLLPKLGSLLFLRPVLSLRHHC